MFPFYSCQASFVENYNDSHLAQIRKISTKILISRDSLIQTAKRKSKLLSTQIINPSV